MKGGGQSLFQVHLIKVHTLTFITQNFWIARSISNHIKKIIHCHGPKPFELFRHMIGKNLSPLMTSIISQGKGMKSPCTALLAFSQIASTESGLISQYCTADFSSDATHKMACINFWSSFLRSNHQMSVNILPRQYSSEQDIVLYSAILSSAFFYVLGFSV